MSTLKPSKAKIGTMFIFIIFSFLNPAMQSIPKGIYKEEIKKYYAFKGETPEIIESRDKYISEAYAQLETPSVSQTERIKALGHLNIITQIIITLILSYLFACIIHRARPKEHA
ncbi:hypothetical protein [Pseudomonas sp.]|uniref:hypothetical protein n=1 Tax=Pseudomonas sp. TaxID=306 RepID=UPI003BB7A8B6